MKSGKFLCLGIGNEMPQRQLVVVYLIYAIVGTLLLMMPFASVRGLPLVDHLFTAVSALSTTGLSTVDVSADYTFWGQLVILLLIQLGGLGYMTLTSFVMLKLTRKFGTKKAQVFTTQFAMPDTIEPSNLLNSVVNFMVFFEVMGVALLYPYFAVNNVSQPLWSAIFHTISAFCTAGFSIYQDNLIRFQTDVYVNVVIMALSYAGAMGFIMMTDLYRKLCHRTHRISFTSKVIMTVTGMLTFFGTVHLFFFERSLQHFDVGDRLLISVFQSMSAMTTVGYNTVDVGLMLPISMFILSIAMYIGASPSGTGGGLKSTTLSAIYAYTRNKLGLHHNISLKGNIIPAYRVDTALTTVIFYTFILGVGVYLIVMFEPTDADFLKILFEASSALATAGLSSGILSMMTTGSKVVLIILMYIGRVGVISFGNAFLATKEKDNKEHCDIAV